MHHLLVSACCVHIQFAAAHNAQHFKSLMWRLWCHYSSVKLRHNDLVELAKAGEPAMYVGSADLQQGL